MSDIFFDEDEDDEELYPLEIEPEPPKRRAGRPKGATNIPSYEKSTADNLRGLVKRVDNYLTPSHRVYMEKVLTGKAEVDPVREMQLLVRYLALLCFTAVEWALDAQKISQPTVALLDAHRMALKDLEDMNRKRRDEDAKTNNDDNMVDPTRKSKIESFIEIDQGTSL